MSQAQHTDIHRKLLLRKALLPKKPCNAYIPFIGDGDIAAELLSDYEINGADIDASRVTKAKQKLPDAYIIVADCDKWPFPCINTPFGLADFDSYSYPYDSFRAFWSQANKADKITMYFTDGQRQTIIRNLRWIDPDGTKMKAHTSPEMRRAYNMYYTGIIMPWFREAIKPYQVVRTLKYITATMLYWGTIVEV